jgi:hypothetical protein
MSHLWILAEDYFDVPGKLLNGWIDDLAGPYLLAVVVLTLMCIWPWIARPFTKRKTTGPEKNQPKHPAIAVTSAVGCALVFGAVLCFFIARYNHMKLAALQQQIANYRSEHPFSSTLFGVPVSDAEINEAKSLSSFAYTFTPPLTSFEMLVFAAFFGGLVLVNYPRYIWEKALAGQGTSRGVSSKGPTGHDKLP